MGSALSKIGVPSGVDTYTAALEGLTGVNEVLLGAAPYANGPYDVPGIKYRNQPHAVWRPAHEVAVSGWGDCEDLSAWRTAQLRVTGEDPGARVAVYPTGPHKYHAIVVRGDGNIEDPSAKLGMRIADRAGYHNRIRAAFGDDVKIDDGTSGDETTGDDVGTLDPRAIRQQSRNYRKRHGLAQAAGPVMRDKRGYRINGAECQGECGCPHVPLGRQATFVVGEDASPEMGQVTFDIVHTPHGFTGVMRVPMQGGKAAMAHTTADATHKGAAKKTAKMAGKMADHLSTPAAKGALTDTSKAAVDVLKSDLGKTALKTAANFVPYGGAALQAADIAQKLPGAGLVKGAAKSVLKKFHL